MKGFVKGVTIFCISLGVFLEALALSGHYHVYRMKYEKENFENSITETTEEAEKQFDYYDNEIERAQDTRERCMLAGMSSLIAGGTMFATHKILDNKKEEDEKEL